VHPAVGEIVGAYTRVVRGGGMLKLCGVAARIQDLPDAASVTAIVESYPSERAALESF
jgi:hypothetical protein